MATSDGAPLDHDYAIRMVSPEDLPRIIEVCQSLFYFEVNEDNGLVDRSTEMKF